jgi:AcrR family transcriptional regulator
MPKVSVEYEQAQRERILEGAAESFADKGYRQTSIDEIARNLGISKGAIYIYFKSKEELFVAIFNRYLSMDHDIPNSSEFANDSVTLKLEYALDRYLSKVFGADPIRLRLLPEFWLEGSRLPELQKLRMEGKRQDFAVLVDLFEQGQARGEVRQDVNICEVAEVIIATCDGLLLNSVTGCSMLDRQAVKQAIWNTFAQVLLPNPHRTTML